MVISDALKDKLKGLVSGEPSVEGPNPFDDRDDFETQDKVLKGMRRMRRRQMDIVEKDKLQNDINVFNRRKASKDFIGTSLFDTKITGLKGLKKVKPQKMFGKSKFF